MATLTWLKMTLVLGLPIGTLGFMVDKAANVGALGSEYEEYRLGYEVDRTADTIIDYYSVPIPTWEAVPKLEKDLGISTRGRGVFRKGPMSIQLPDVYPGYMTTGMFAQANPWEGGIVIGVTLGLERETLLPWRTKIVVTTEHAGGVLTKVRRLLHL